ncbi:MAG TPA: hypothetical protein VMV62_00330 [Candidatus Paceibacterota bacterium]|nr:hypothetical protein [Candidatus Paceibacterota bacterium]
MPDQPLRPFSPPSIPSDLLGQLHLPTGMFSAGAAVTWVLYAVFAIWALYTLVAIYHWLRYSHASLIALPAIAAHLFISFALMSYTLSGHAFFFASYLP